MFLEDLSRMEASLGEPCLKGIKFYEGLILVYCLI